MMVENIMVNGRRDNNMEMEHFKTRKEKLLVVPGSLDKYKIIIDLFFKLLFFLLYIIVHILDNLITYCNSINMRTKR